jgi:hypothetical protein
LCAGSVSIGHPHRFRLAIRVPFLENLKGHNNSERGKEMRKNIFAVLAIVLMIGAFLQPLPVAGAATQEMIGADESTTPDISNAGNYFVLSRFTATASGTISEFKIRCTASGNVKVAIYADNNGEPGDIKPGASATKSVNAGWNTIAFPSTTIDSGTSYWLASCSDGNIVGAKAGAGYRRYKPVTFSTFTFPSNADGGFTVNVGYYDIVAGWGTIVITAPVITNLFASASSTTATLCGKLISDGGAPTYRHIYWGPTDGGTDQISWKNDLDLGLSPGPSGAFASVVDVTNGTTYHFRCYAENSAGHSWAPSSYSFVAQDPVKLIGADESTTPDISNAGNYFVLSRFTATASGTITEFKIRCTAPGNVKVAIYADNSGEPGDIMPGAFATQSVVAGWNTIYLPYATINSGTSYWLASCSDGNIVGAKAGAANRRYKPVTYSTFSFPSNADGGFTVNTAYYDIVAGWGTIVITAPTVTNASGATNITSTSARLNGYLTSDGGASTTVHIFWGDNDGGTGTWDHDQNLGIKFPGAFYFDASGLTNGTKYYYRCCAKNSEAESWADSTSSFIACTPAKLIGADESTTPDISNAGNYFVLSRFTAPAPGTITELRVRCVSSGHIKLALYDDFYGEPSNLIPGAFTDSIPVVAGWNTIPFPPTEIYGGQQYWLASCSDGNIVGAKAGAGYRRYQPVTYSTFTFPSNADGGFTVNNSHYDIVAGWGIMYPPPKTALVSPTSTIELRWSTGGGATKYQLQVNTNPSFLPGTNLIDEQNLTTGSFMAAWAYYGTTYYWRVRGANDCGWGDWSSIGIITVNMIP